jgi:endonuclease G
MMTKLRNHKGAALLLALALLVNCGGEEKIVEPEPEPTSIISDDDNLYWGVASDTGIILDKDYFVINYNCEWKIPYWVGYYLNDSLLIEVDSADRQSSWFEPDPELPANCQIEYDDYTNSGWDRGHNAPDKSFRRSHEARLTTYVMSNMTPQNGSLNSGKWKQLEDSVRARTERYGHAWVITGGLFMDEDSNLVEPDSFIGDKEIAVPTHCRYIHR